MSNTNANNKPNNSNNKTNLPLGNRKKKVIAVTSGVIIAILVIIAIVGITSHSSNKYEKADDSYRNYFCVENSAGTIYNMEIDKKGNLIKNEVSPYQK